MRKKRIMAWSLAGVLTMAIVATAAWLRFGEPYCFAMVDFPDWLDYHVREIRIAEQRPPEPGVLRLRGVSIGPAGRALLEAPEAALEYAYALTDKFGAPEFVRWRLQNTRLEFRKTADGYSINNYRIAEFITALCALPPGPDGQFVPVAASGTIAVAGAPEPGLPYELKFFRRNNPAQPHEPLFTFDFSFGQGDFAGRWRSVYNPANRTLDTDSSGDLSFRVFHALAQAAGLPAFATLSGMGDTVRGTGAFLTTLPDLKIDEYSFTGEFFNPKLRIGKLGFDAAEPVKFTLAVMPQGSSLTLPKLTIHSPAEIPLKNLVLKTAPQSPQWTASCIADFRAAFNNHLRNAYRIDSQLPWPLELKLTGSVHWPSGKWQFAAEPLTPGQKPLTLSAGPLALRANLTRFTWSGAGQAERGELKSDIRFQDLTLKNADSELRIPAGALKTRWQLAPGKTELAVKQGSADFDCSELNMFSGARQLVMTRLLGAVDLTPAQAADGAAEFYVVGRSEALSSNGWRVDLNGNDSNFEFTVRLEPPGKGVAIPAFNWRYRDLKTRTKLGFNFDFEQPTVRGTARLDAAGALTDYELFGGAASFKGELFNAKSTVVAPEWVSHYRRGGGLKDAPATADWTTELKFANVEITTAAARWNGRDGRATAAGLVPTRQGMLPLTFALQADTLTGVLGGVRGDFRRSRWDFTLGLATDRADATGLQLALTADNAALHTTGAAGEMNNLKLNWRSDWQPVYRTGKLVRSRLEFEWDDLLWHWRGLGFGSGKTAGGFRYQNLAQPFFETAFKSTGASLIGSQFSLLMPDLEIDGSYHRDAGARGHLRFTGGSAESKVGQLDLNAITLDLPWHFLSPRPVPEEEADPGRLAIGRVKFANHGEGSVEALIRQHNATVDIEGVLNSLKFDNSAAALTACITLPPREPKLTMNFDLPPTRLKAPVALAAWYPTQAKGVTLVGKVAAKGRIESDFSTVGVSGELNFDDADFEFGAARLSGVTGPLIFTDLVHLVSQPDARLKFKRFAWDKWQLTDGQGAVSFKPEGEMVLAGVTGELAGGKVVSVEPIRFSRFRPVARQEVGLAMRAEKLPLENFLPLLGIPEVESGIAATGTLNAILQRGRIRFMPSVLSFKDPAGAFLGIRSVDKFSVKLNDRNYQAFTFAVLRAMRCRRAQFDFSDTGNLLALKINAEGTPAAPVPFVYQGSAAASPFRPAAPDEKGFDGELEMKIDLQLPLPDNH